MAMSVLLSVKPKYVDEIVNGNKKYEFRKAIWKRNGFKTVYVYSSAPVKKIVGAFTIGEIIEDSPKSLWERLNEFAGIGKKEFFSYFNTQETGFAIEIGDFDEFADPINPYEEIPGFRPPQSFYYFDETRFNH